MHRITAAVSLVSLMLFGCGAGSSVEAIRNGLPSTETAQLTFPQPSSAHLDYPGQQRQALQGETSGFYDVTRFVTGLVNGGTGLVLVLVKAITDNPPTSFKHGVAVWGPHTDALNPVTYRFTATDNGNHSYSYVLEGKAKQDPDTAYKVLLSGNHTAATDSNGHPIRGFGNGNFRIDWDAASTLPEHTKDVGAADFTYSRATTTSQVEIKVTFTGTWDDDAKQRVNASYEYLSTPGADGRFRFSVYRTRNSTLERWAIESRWKNSGAGRSDVIVTNSGVVLGNVNECWDQFFKSKYQSVSYDLSPSQNYGTEATDCAFIGAEYPP